MPLLVENETQYITVEVPLMIRLREQYDKIYRYCYFRVRSASLAEDITQEAFLRFFSDRNYINRGKPLAYLYTVARNLCADSFRRPEQAELKENTARAASEIEPAETAIALSQAMDILSDDARELLLLRYANDLSMAEISAITGMSRFAARRMINCSLKSLRGILSKEDFN